MREKGMIKHTLIEMAFRKAENMKFWKTNVGGVIYIYCNEQPSQATETPSVEKHAHPPRVVYCAIYLTLTLITKFRVSNLHITTR